VVKMAEGSRQGYHRTARIIAAEASYFPVDYFRIKRIKGVPSTGLDGIMVRIEQNRWLLGVEVFIHHPDIVKRAMDGNPRLLKKSGEEIGRL